MDLLGRKMGMKNGKVFMAFLREIGKTVALAKETEGLKNLAGRVEKANNRLGEVAMNLGRTALSPKLKMAFAFTTPVLDIMGDVTMAWMLLWRASIAASKINNSKKKDVTFYEGQIKTAEFFINTILPVTMGKMDAVLESSPAAIEISAASFGGL